MKTIKRVLPLAIGLLLSQQALATNGYFSHGYGVKSQGIGGVGIALPQDALAAATNPAGLGLVGDRVDFGLTWFRPDRETKISGSPAPGANGTYDANETQDFFIPEFGYNRQINPNVTLGVSVYGNGGMNTDYEKAIPLFGSSRAGIDYIQLFVAPTVTWKVTPDQIIGASVNLAYQRLEVKGLQNFAAFSSSGGNLTNRGHDNAYGAGLHLGWIGKVNDAVTLGATYQSKIYFSEFDKYRGLLAEHGDMDTPATYGVGIAVKTTPQLTVAADVQRILYSDVRSIGSKLARFSALGIPLGASNGAGFGWRDVTVFKVGANYAYSDALTLRAGYDHTTQPIPKGETLFNILAPGIVQDHLSLGATWQLPNKAELSVGYTHAFDNTVNGTGAIPAAFGGGNVKLKMNQDSLGVAYGWNL